MSTYCEKELTMQNPSEHLSETSTYHSRASYERSRAYEQAELSVLPIAPCDIISTSSNKNDGSFDLPEDKFD